MEKIKLGENWTDKKRMEYFATERSGGWRIERVVTDWATQTICSSLEEAREMVKRCLPRVLLYDFVGEYVDDKGRRVVIYSMPLSPDFHGVEFHREGMSTGYPMIFDSEREIRDWLLYLQENGKISNLKLHQEETNERGYKTETTEREA